MLDDVNDDLDTILESINPTSVPELSTIINQYIIDCLHTSISHHTVL